METSSFEGETQIDKVVSLLNDFKKCLHDVNYLNKLINQNANDIINSDYNTVIKPFIDKKYINFVNNTNTNIERYDFYVCSINTDEKKWDENYHLYSSRFPTTENIKFNDSRWDALKIDKNSKDYFIVNNSEKNIYNIIKKSSLSVIKYLNDCLKINPELTYIYQFDIREDPDGVLLVIRCVRRDVKNIKNWISISSSVKLMPYFNNAQNLNSLSKTEFLFNFNKIINNLLVKLESSQWNDNSLIKNIWEYSNISNIANTKCLYSEKYPNWNGQLISDCFIPNSNIDLQSNMNKLFNDLYFYYPSLTVGELAFSTRNLDGTNILSICKIDTYNGVQCIKEVKILLDNIFMKNYIIGDTIMYGNLNIKDGNGDSVVQTDNVTKNISIHGKVGINQDLHEIKGLLDIDNLSNENILTIVDKISDLNNTSYYIVNEIKDSILNNGTFNISADYTNEIIILKVPIKIKIEESDISFLHKPSNIFKTNKFSNDSFLKIQLIINEINRMNIEIENYNVQEGKKLIMSFVELLNDNEYYYVCSLKAIFKGSDIYFVMSFTLVQNIMVDNSYSKIFTKLINKLSSLNRIVNYSILVINLPSIYNKLIEGDSINSFTKYIQDGEFNNRFGLEQPSFIWCNQHFSGNTLDYNNSGKYLFAEDYPEYNLKKFKDVFIPNTNRTIADIEFQSLSYYQNNYGLFKTSQNFIVHYLFNKGEKISFLNKIMIKGNEYFIGVGINLSDYIDLNIISTGDNKITGNLYIEDENSATIFAVDTEYNKIVNMYKTGFGTDYPKTIIDVNDSGITDIINIIKNMASQEHSLNLNIEFIKNIDTITAVNIDNCINSQFINLDGTIGYKQTKDDYFYCYPAPINDNPNDFENIYVWLYRNWDNKKFINIDDKNNKLIINNFIDIVLNNFKKEYNFVNARTISTNDWTFGKKFRSRRLFKNKTDNKTYLFGNGINIGNYNLKINNNGNISTFFENIDYMNLYLENFIIRYNNIDITSIPNYKSVNDYFSIISNIVSPKQFTLKKIVTDFTDYYNTKVYDIDFNTKVVSGNDLNKTIYQIQNINERSKYLLMLTNINSIYSKNNNNPQLFNKEDYGIINIEDNFADYISLFYCSEVTATSVTLISIELQINTIINPSVDIRGDLRVKGDTYFHNNNTNTDFVSIDTNESFLGIGTNERYVNYSNNYISTTNNDLSRHKFIVSGRNYPVAVVERLAEIEPQRDTTTNNIINYPDFALEYFTNRVGLSGRRKSNYYTVKEMKEYADKYTSIAIGGPYKGQPVKYRYGIDFGFEIQDSTQITREIGAIQMVIDDIDSNNNILAGFSVETVDISKISNESVSVARQLMYINNDSVMNVDKIKLGMDANESNNVLLSAKNNDLLINNVSLINIINNQIQSMFSVDENGKLNIMYNGNTYVCEKKI
jgi:hypothetical protein